MATLQIRQPIVEFDLHSHRAERFDEMGLVWQQEAGITGLQDHFGIWFEHLIAQSPFKHPNDAPYAGLGAVFPTQPRRQRRFIEDRECTCMSLSMTAPFAPLTEASHFGNEWLDRRDRSYGPLPELSEGAE